MLLAHAYLGERDDVQREVELPVTTAWQTVSRVVAAGDLDRCDAGIAGERGGAGEPARTPGPPEQPPGDDGTDAGDIPQSGAVRVEGVRDLGGECLQPLIGVADLGDQVAGQVFARSFDGTCRTHAGEQSRRVNGG